MTLSPERRAEIEAMLEQRTPGEWFYETTDGSVQSRTIERDGYVNEDIVYYIVNADRDGPFLAASPAIIHELLAEIDRLNEVLSSTEAAMEYMMYGSPDEDDPTQPDDDQQQRPVEREVTP
jgi:hypothetical protein